SGGGGTTFGPAPDNEFNPELNRPALAELPAFCTDGGRGTTGKPPVLGAFIARPAEGPPSSGAGATAACGSASRRAVAWSTWGGGATTPDGPATAFRRRRPAVAENGTIGVTAWEPRKLGSLAVACLMSGGVTMPGFCSGVTRIAGSCASVCFTRDRARTLGALPAAAGKDFVGG